MVLVCVGSASLLPTAAASAQTKHELHPGGMELTIPLGVKDHLFLSLAADDEQRVKLSVSELFSSAGYTAEGKVSSSRIEADFGQLGRVDVKIHLHPRGSKPPATGKNCSGRPPLELTGTYRGTIDFSGEREIPALGSRHGRVVFVRRFRRVCKKPVLPSGLGKERRKSPLELGLLTVEGHAEDRTSQFVAIDLTSKKTPAVSFGIVLAGTFERVGQVLLARSTLNFAGGKELTMSKHSKGFETFGVEPETPFAGRAVFSRSRNSPSTWRGDLSVRLPGARPVPLTGPRFSADLCRASFAACIDELDGLSRPFRDDFLSHLLDTHRAAVKTSEPSNHQRGVLS